MINPIKVRFRKTAMTKIDNDVEIDERADGQTQNENENENENASENVYSVLCRGEKGVVRVCQFTKLTPIDLSM